MIDPDLLVSEAGFLTGPSGMQRHDAPISRNSNRIIAGEHFNARFGRWPVGSEDPAATVNDLIFDRMIDPSWSAYERAFVDKETAKIEALALCPTLRVPQTLLVISTDEAGSVDGLFERLKPFVGTASIAKPTQASGGVTLMANVKSPADLRGLFELASNDYALILREMQYFQLPGNVLVESLVPAASSPPDDYKFHCVNGEPLVCQVDHGRSGHSWSRLLRMPDFWPLDISDGLEPPATFHPAVPERIASMVAVARALSAPFEFVRVDLYDGEDGIYFGELTFTPAASLGIAPSALGDHAVNPTHRAYSDIIMDAYRAGRR